MGAIALDAGMSSLSPIEEQEEMETISDRFNNALSAMPFEKLDEEKKALFTSYVNIMREVFAKASIQGNRFGDKSHTNTTELKRDIRKNSKAAAELQEKIGKAAFYSAIFGLAFMGMQLSPEREAVRSALKWMGETGSQTINNMYSSYKAAEKSIIDALVAMRQTEYQAISQKDPAASMQQNLQQLLDVAQSMYTKAAAPT